MRTHWLYNEKPFSKFQAWMDILLSANHKDNKFMLGNELVEVERGSFITSELKLMERWGWSNTKVRSFLSLLESDGMLIKTSDRKKSILTIVNYNDYQDTESDKKVIKKYKNSDKKVIKNTNKNEKKEKNDKNDKKEDIYVPIIDYLNSKADKKYQTSTKKTHSLIDARINEGFTLEDFYKVIDNKVSEWKGDKSMDKFLRPETLFGNKFEGYLNQDINITNKVDRPSQKTRFHNFEGRTDKYTADELEDVAARKRREHREKMKAN